MNGTRHLARLEITSGWSAILVSKALASLAPASVLATMTDFPKGRMTFYLYRLDFPEVRVGEEPPLIQLPEGWSR